MADDSKRRTGTLMLIASALLELGGILLLLMGLGVIGGAENTVLTAVGAALFFVANGGIMAAVLMMRR